MKVIVITPEEFLQLKAELISSVTIAVTLALENKKTESTTDWVNWTEAKKIINYFSKTSWQKLRDEGKVIFTQSGRKILYSKKSLENFLNKNTIKF